MPYDPYGTYSSNGGKVDWANLAERNVKTIILKTVENSSSKSTSGEVTSYNVILAEDASNSVPLANDILPDSNVPSDTTRDAYIFFDVPWPIIDFVFE
jgi:hypothetical protein